MTCEEAQQLMEIVWDLPEHDLRRRRLQDHLQGCRSCAAEYEMWVESMEMVHSLKHEVSDIEAENVNRNVMDRIYRDFPWLVEETSKSSAISRVFRKRLIIWIAGFLALFVSSLLYFALTGSSSEPQPEAAPTGIIPTGVAGSNYGSYNIPKTNSGIIDPFVAGMKPTEPEYWMVLSILGVGLALIFLRRLNRVRR
ncbi:MULTISPECIES: anti-sigma factor family protein [Paenibacillus]|uniref:Anti-sigma factor n=1 Tax=Paenibacillus campinasensis TaxID=66347 RepID=A0A268F2Y2_9BACL|nr:MULTISPECIES: anti-sigma factor [Paenibacillus]MUG65019.1 anti-sigma factor [Paenibacillus campinasensis]PAD79730.1 anti-sigma factor [Paenibacillus campinasensis]PAK53594.1 anti-sigma factor [Paenibacillus sp. 7541]